MYLQPKPEQIMYLGKALLKISTSDKDELNRLKQAVNNPSFEWSAEDKVILHEAIDKRLKEI
jgi:hypothetical protein